jgi:hypothetical protein
MSSRSLFSTHTHVSNFLLVSFPYCVFPGPRHLSKTKLILCVRVRLVFCAVFSHHKGKGICPGLIDAVDTAIHKFHSESAKLKDCFLVDDFSIFTLAMPASAKRAADAAEVSMAHLNEEDYCDSNTIFVPKQRRQRELQKTRALEQEQEPEEEEDLQNSGRRRARKKPKWQTDNDVDPDWRTAAPRSKRRRVNPKAPVVNGAAVVSLLDEVVDDDIVDYQSGSSSPEKRNARVGAGRKSNNLTPYRQLDATRYIEFMKQFFTSESGVYKCFFAILKQFKSQQLTTGDVMIEVARLFKGNDEFIVGFNKFLPAGQTMDAYVPSEKDEDVELLVVKNADELREELKTLVGPEMFLARRRGAFRKPPVKTPNSNLAPDHFTNTSKRAGSSLVSAQSGSSAPKNQASVVSHFIHQVTESDKGDVRLAHKPSINSVLPAVCMAESGRQVKGTGPLNDMAVDPQEFVAGVSRARTYTFPLPSADKIPVHKGIGTKHDIDSGTAFFRKVRIALVAPTKFKVFFAAFIRATEHDSDLTRGEGRKALAEARALIAGNQELLVEFQSYFPSQGCAGSLATAKKEAMLRGGQRAAETGSSSLTAACADASVAIIDCTSTVGGVGEDCAIGRPCFVDDSSDSPMSSATDHLDHTADVADNNADASARLEYAGGMLSHEQARISEQLEAHRLQVVQQKLMEQHQFRVDLQNRALLAGGMLSSAAGMNSYGAFDGVGSALSSLQGQLGVNQHRQQQAQTFARIRQHHQLMQMNQQHLQMQQQQQQAVAANRLMVSLGLGGGAARGGMVGQMGHAPSMATQSMGDMRNHAAFGMHGGGLNPTTTQQQQLAISLQVQQQLQEHQMRQYLLQLRQQQSAQFSQSQQGHQQGPNVMNLLQQQQSVAAAAPASAGMSAAAGGGLQQFLMQRLQQGTHGEVVVGASPGGAQLPGTMGGVGASPFLQHPPPRQG